MTTPNLVSRIKFAEQEMEVEDYYYYIQGLRDAFVILGHKDADFLSTITTLAEMRLVRMNRIQAI